MRKLILTFTFGLGFTAANAILLFPFFTDVTGNYQEGSPEVFEQLRMPCMYWQKPTVFNTLEEADTFLDDVMPYANEPITRAATELEGDITVVTYTSPMTDGKTSIIYLLKTPHEGFLAGYNETNK